MKTLLSILLFFWAPLIAKTEQDGRADLIVFSYDRAMQAHAFFESAFQHLKGLNEVHLIYRSSSSEHDSGYKILANAFPQVQMHKQSNQPFQDFKPLVLSSVYSASTSKYVVFAVDDIIVKDAINLVECTQALEEYDAWGFFLRLGKNIHHCYMMQKDSPCPPGKKVGKDMFLWKFKSGTYDWNYPNNVDMTIYRKKDIQSFLRSVNYIHPNSLEGKWAGQSSLKTKGICFTQSKILNIPLNLVNPSTNRTMNAYSPKELLRKYLKGYKLEFKIPQNNKSPHMDLDPAFILR